MARDVFEYFIALKTLEILRALYLFWVHEMLIGYTYENYLEQHNFLAVDCATALEAPVLLSRAIYSRE